MTGRVQTIAKTALALPPSERTEYLTRCCADDADLRSRVDDLLDMMESQTLVPGSVTGESTSAGAMPSVMPDGVPAGPSGTAAPTGPEPERWIGRHRVLDLIGSGAMGVVYLAEQQTPKRRIALKVIRPDVVTDALRSRFEQETRVLARLKHPAIAQIYDAGNAAVEGEDCPYFAMELVAGDMLDRRARGLPLADRIALLREVCAGVEHAHQRGVVHRDLKPANIVVDEQGRPRILDFGVARALDGETAQRSERVGTLPYMSPEQLRGDADTDTRADVYALGIILCELVTGHRPHDLSKISREDAPEHLEQTPPTPLRELDGSAPRDLEAIASRALARDPDDRYPTAAALSDDLSRFLRREPVDARPRRPLYVAARFTQRNTGAVVAGLIGLLAIAGGIAGVSWQAVEATRGWARAEDEANRVRAINAFYTSMLASADPENAMGEELTVRELLDTAARHDARGLEDEPAAESAVRLAMATTYRGLGALDEALAQARGAVEASTLAFGARDAVTADAVQALAVVQLERGDFDEAERLLESVIEILAETMGTEAIETIAARGELARVYHESGRTDEALVVWKDCLDAAERLAGPDHKSTLVLKHNYGSALGAMGRFEEAERVLSEVVSRRSVVFGDLHPQTVGARSMLASFVQRLGRNGEAAEHFRAILRARTEVLGEDHHSTHTARANLAVPLIELGELNEAERLNREALAGLRAALPEDHAKILILMSTQAYLLEDMGRDEEAEALYREQIVLRERSTGGRDPATWSSYNNLAMLLQRTGRLDEAVVQFERLLAMCRENLPEGHILTAIFENNFGSCLAELGRYEGARVALERSHAIISASFPEGHARVTRSLERLEALPAP